MFDMNPMKSLKTFARLNFRTVCLSLHLKQFERRTKPPLPYILGPGQSEVEISNGNIQFTD